ncbi:DUF2878 domain-containing protein [Marinobacter sp.]|uniref:DUF2878 domain-containing protein n=1 Tax=Marinobacter sp. TaxID=50741 RepID=UPI00356898DA
MTPDVRRKVANFILFQAGWLICVLMTDWAAVAIGLGLVALHLVVLSERPLAEFRFILVGVVIGSVLDGLWFRTGVLQDPAGSGWTPPWLVVIWALFLTTLSHSLSWMHRRRWYQLLFAPVAGPFAYFTAAALGAVSLPLAQVSLVALSLGWLALFPALMLIQQRYFAETLS